MPVDRDQLERRLAVLEVQRREAEKSLCTIEGAISLCRELLDMAPKTSVPDESKEVPERSTDVSPARAKVYQGGKRIA